MGSHIVTSGIHFRNPANLTAACRIGHIFCRPLVAFCSFRSICGDPASSVSLGYNFLEYSLNIVPGNVMCAVVCTEGGDGTRENKALKVEPVVLLCMVHWGCWFLKGPVCSP